VVGDRAPADVYDKARLALGLDKPYWQQFATYIGKVFTGDLGTSVLTAQKVTDDIKTVFPATLELATLGTLIGVALGVPLGILAAVNQGRWIDQIARVIGLIGYSIPVFWLGLLGLLLFYAKLGWVAGPGRLSVAYQDFVTPVTGLVMLDAAMQGEWEAVIDAFWHLILPASVLGLLSVAYISRMTRSFMITELQQQYVVAARVKGLSEWRVVCGHALGNAFVPLVTVIALSYMHLLEGSVLTETIFAWPGLGRYITNALLNADMNAVLGGTLVVGAVFIAVNLFSDILGRLPIRGRAEEDGHDRSDHHRRHLAFLADHDRAGIAPAGQARPALPAMARLQEEPGCRGRLGDRAGAALARSLCAVDRAA
jgi:peptide/nickel transport system permease protein